MRRSLDQAGCITSDSARRTGLPPGTPVYTGCIDCEAAAIGSGVRDPGEVSVVAGTWSINQAFIKRVPRVGGHFLVNPSAEPGRWLVLEGSPSSAANFDWALRTFGGKAADITEAVRKTRHSQLIFMPQVPSGKGAFVGLSSVHTRHDLYRAVMEGVVHAHRRHLERLARSAGPISRVTLGGGAARNTVWCRLFADGLGIQVDVPRVEETGALGAAMCAGVGCGLFPSLREAQLAMSSPKRTFLPDPKRHEETSGDYERYLSLCESIQP
ncbi:MAG: FGGY-family carbohydrate kinase [Opitutaceae bacterium]